MITIVKANLDYLDDIEKTARISNEYMVPNNRMIYYLCCTVFSKYSLVALKDDVAIGYLFAFPDSGLNFIWIHQLAVIPEERNKGIGGRLLYKLKSEMEKDNNIKTIRFAVRKENLASWRIAAKHNCRCFGIDPYINMEVFEKQL
jgi:GNAT superfamily N-acetyltransferase